MKAAAAHGARYHTIESESATRSIRARASCATDFSSGAHDGTIRNLSTSMTSAETPRQLRDGSQFLWKGLARSSDKGCATALRREGTGIAQNRA